MKDILVVEEDAASYDVLSSLLYGGDYKVDRATSSGEAMKKLRRGRPDVMLVDLEMSMLDAWTVLDTCRKDAAFAEVPIVVLASGPEDTSATTRFRPHACLTKPVPPLTLLRALELATRVPASSRLRATMA